MKPSVAAGCGAIAWPAPVLLAMLMAPPTARADLWTAENRLESRLESNDNYLLAPKSKGTVNTLSVSDTLKASHQTEAGATRVDAVVSALSARGTGGESRVDGRLSVSQTLTTPLDEYSLAALYAQDFNDSVQTADVTVGRGRRRITTLNGGWLHSLTERLSTSLQLSYDRTSFAQAGASAYGDTSLGASVSYRLSDTDSVSLQGARSDYRSDVGRSQSRTDSVSVGANRALSERSNASLSIGTYRTRSSLDAFGLACPIAAIFCESGLVAPVAFPVRLNSSSRGLQYRASYRYQVDERTGLALAAARQQSPSGTGSVVRSDTVNASATRSFSETLNGSLNYAESRSTQEVAGSGRVGQRQLSLVLGRQLSEDISFAATYQRTDSDFGGGRARSNSIALSISVDWPRRFEANH